MTHDELDWETRGACNGMDTERFFPEFDHLLEPEVIAACAFCPVRSECLDWALIHDEAGVWGGLTELQRQQITTVRTRVRCPDCRSERVAEQEHSEICLNCGLSWPI